MATVADVGQHDLVARLHEQLGKQLDDRLAAVPDHDVLEVHTVVRRNSVLDVEEALLRVLPDVAELCLDGLKDARRGPVRILVGGELGDIAQAQLALHLIGRGAGDVLAQLEHRRPEAAVLAGRFGPGDELLFLVHVALPTVSAAGRPHARRSCGPDKTSGLQTWRGIWPCSTLTTS